MLICYKVFYIYMISETYVLKDTPHSVSNIWFQPQGVEQICLFICSINKGLGVRDPI